MWFTNATTNNISIMFRCIKGSHILVNHNGVAILSGFKFAINVTEGTEKLDRTDPIKLRKYLYWLSPEMLAQVTN